MTGALNADMILGRYALFAPIATGGMATVHLGRLIGPGGFSRTVAIKRLHANLASDPEFVVMFMDEARLAARIRHPNVVPIIDVVAAERELLLVMDYVEGESLSRLLGNVEAGAPRPSLPVVVKIMCDVLAGLHAAHEATGEQGESLLLVHRDISPQNVLVGADGSARVIDFGVAKAAGRAQNTKDGVLKGKLAYMSPEQLRSSPVDRRSDIYAASVVLWQALACEKMFPATDATVLYAILEGKVPSLKEHAPETPDEVCALVAKGLALSPDDRFETANEMAAALEKCVRPATAREVASWVAAVAAPALRARARQVTDVETSQADAKALIPLLSALAPAGTDTTQSESNPVLPAHNVIPVGTELLGSGSASNVSNARSIAPPAKSRGWPIALGIALVCVALVAIGMWRYSAVEDVPSLAQLSGSSAAVNPPDSAPIVASASVVVDAPVPTASLSASAAPSAEPPPTPSKPPVAQPGNQPSKRRKDRGF